VLNAFLDPILGHLSDNTHTRWGRRKPFLLSASILGALLLMAMWWANPASSEWAKFVHLVVFGTLCYVCYGLYALVWAALGYELSDDYNERSRVAAIASVVLTVVLLANGWTYWFALRPMFGDSMPDGTIRPNEVTGMRWISGGVAILVIACALLAAFVCKERFTHANLSKRQPLLPALRTTLKNRPFVILLLFRFFQLFGERVYGGILFYLGLYYVCRGNKDLATRITGLGAAIGAVCGVAIVPFVKRFSQTFGKRGGLIIVAGVAFASALAQPVILNPSYPFLLLIPSLLVIPLTAITDTMDNAIVPDICDADELQTGERREGLFTAVLGFVTKLEISVTILIVGYLVSFAGLDPKLPSQPAPVLEKLFWLGTIPNLVFTLAALALAVRFPMTEASMAEVRRHLDARHQAHPEEAPERSDAATVDGRAAT
jgi:GPH family glycoside/pentoside/hexuronide:cation symporter